MRRSLVWVALALTLAGCNQVYSAKPVFSTADEAGAPALRPGLWVMASAKCSFNEARPVQRWPDCADWVLIRQGQIVSLETKDGKPDWSAIDTVLAAGDPRVLQWHEPESADHHYAYAGLQPTATDVEGRITAIEAWPALCGPPPPEDAKSKVTANPLPGLRIDGSDCYAEEAGPVRASAKASRAWAADRQAAHWVRDALP